jgi:hypothetical protein
MTSGFHSWLGEQPLWLIALLLFLAMAAAAWLGSQVRQALKPRLTAQKALEAAATPEKDDDAETFILSSVLGLLALLLGFTFSLAVDRYDARRVLVLTEANAIGTAYLRAQLLPEPHRARLSDVLVRYTENRVRLGSALRRDAEAERLIEHNDALVTEIVQTTDAAFPSIQHLDFSSTFLDTINQVVDLDATRKAARRARVPPPVFSVLFLYAIGSAGMLGYIQRIRHPTQVGLLLALLTLVLSLIVDIDRPTSGLINEDQRPMVDLRRNMARWRPEVIDRFRREAPATALAPPELRRK